MIYYQLKADYCEHNKGDLFTLHELETYKHSDKFPSQEHCRIISTKKTNIMVNGDNPKLPHRRLKNSGNCRKITEDGGNYRL